MPEREQHPILAWGPGAQQGAAGRSAKDASFAATILEAGSYGDGSEARARCPR